MEEEIAVITWRLTSEESEQDVYSKKKKQQTQNDAEKPNWATSIGAKDSIARPGGLA